MCETCVDAEEAADEIHKCALSYNSEDPQTWGDEDQMRYKVWSTVVALADAHQRLAKHQREAFEHHCKNVRPGHIVLCVDWKAKVMLGQKLKQLGREFYQIPMRSLLGVTLIIHPEDFERISHLVTEKLGGYLFNIEVQAPADVRIDEVEVDRRGKTRTRNGDAPAEKQPVYKRAWKVHFELVTEVVAQNGWHTIECFKALFQHEFVRALAPKGIDLWMDNGAHFKNKEVYAYLADQEIISWHHFAPCHGKSVCDTRFATIQHWFNQHVLTSPVAMNSVEDVVQVIARGQAECNASNVRQGVRPTISFQQVVQVDRADMPAKVEILQFDGVRALFSFVVRKGLVWSSSYTDVQITAATKKLPAPYQKLKASRQTVDRLVKELVHGLPDPLPSTAVENLEVIAKAQLKAQSQRLRAGDDTFVADVVKQKVAQVIPARNSRKRSRPTNTEEESLFVGDDDEFTAPASKRPSASSSTASGSSAPTRTYFTRQRGKEPSLRQAAQALKKAALKVASKKKLSAADRSLIDGFKEVYRAELRARGNTDSATSLSVGQAGEALAAITQQALPRDYADEKEDRMDVDDDSMAIGDDDDDDDAMDWDSIPDVPYNLPRRKINSRA